MNKCILLLLCLLFVTSLVVAEGEVAEGGVGGEFIGVGQFELSPTIENFMLLEQPTAELLAQVPSPTEDNFRFLMENDGQQAADYLFDNYDNEFAHVFYQDAEQSRTNIEYNVETAQQYFRENYGAEYVFDVLTEDFLFDQETGVLRNSGQSIALSDYQDRSSILGIEVVGDGFIIREAERSVTLSGEQETTISYDADTNRYTLDGIGTFVQQYDAENNPRSGNVVISAAADGIRIEGPVQGEVIVGDERIRYINRRGELFFSANGDIESTNAEVITRNLYIDGAVQYNAEQGRVLMWDHAAGNLGNVRRGHTVVVYDGVGVVSQGQQRGSGEQVEVFIDQIADFSRHAPNVGESTGTELSDEERRQRARAIPPNEVDLGESGQVWISRLDSNELLVTAKGRVEVGNYDGNVLLPDEPVFQGRSGQAELDLRSNGETHIDVRGEAGLAYDQGFIETQQDGASIAMQIDGEQEIMDVNCFGCPPTGEVAVSLRRDIIIGNPALGDGIFGEVTREPLTINVLSGEYGLEYGALVSDLGNFAETLGDGVAIMGRNIDVSLHSTETTEQLLRLSQPDDEQALSAYIETYENDVFVGPWQAISLGIQNVIGNAMVVTTEQNIAETERLLALLEEERFSELASAGLQFENDPRLRQHILQETLIDIDLLANEEYVRDIQEAAERQQEFRDYRERIRSRYDITLDDTGACVNPPECADAINRAMSRGGTLGYLYTNARIRLLQAENEALDAYGQSLALDGEEGTAAQKSANRREIRNLRQVREQMDQLHEQREAEEMARQVAEAEAEYDMQVEFLEQWEAQDTEHQIADAEAAYDMQVEFLEQYVEQDRRFSITDGIDPEGAHELRQQAAYLGRRRETALHQVAEIDTQVVILQERAEELREQMGSNFAYTTVLEGDLAPSRRTHNPQERLLQQLSQVQQELTDMELQRRGLQQSYVSMEQEANELAMQLIEDRPDTAAELLIDAGLTDAAREVAEEHVASVVPERALEITALAHVADGNIAAAAVNAAEMEDPTIVYQELGDLVVEELEERVERDRELVQGRLDDFYAERAPTLGNRVSHFFTASGGLTLHAIASLTPEVSLDDPTILELQEQEDLRSRAALEENLHNSREFLNMYRSALERGETPQEAFDTIPDHIRNALESAGTDARFYRGLEQQAQGHQLSDELRAQIELDDAMKTATRHNGNTFLIEQDLEAIAENYAGTEAAATAQYMDEQLDVEEGYTLDFGLFELEIEDELVANNRNVQQYGDIAIESVGVENFLPFVTLARLGAAARTARQARTVAEVGQATQRVSRVRRVITTGVDALPASVRTVATDTRLAIREGGRSILNTAGAPFRGIQRLSGTRGRAITDNIVQAERTVEAARGSENAADLVQAQQRLADLRVIQQAQSARQSSNILLSERRLFVGRKALAEAQDASQAFDAALGAAKARTGVVSSSIATSPELVQSAQQVIAASRKAHEATIIGKLEQRLVTAARARSQARAVQIQRDLQALHELGVTGRRVDIPPREGGVPSFIDNIADYDYSHLPVEQHAEAQRLIDNIQEGVDASGLSRRQIIELAENGDFESIKLLHPSSSQNQARAVMDDLAGQAARKGDGVVPVVTPGAAADAALAQPVPGTAGAQARLAQTTPLDINQVLPTIVRGVTPEGIEYVAGGAAALDDSLRALVNQRKAIYGDFAEVRRIDYQILAHPQVRPLLDDIPRESMHPLIREFLDSGGDIARNSDVVAVSAPKSLAVAREQAVTGSVAGKGAFVTPGRADAIPGPTPGRLDGGQRTPIVIPHTKLSPEDLGTLHVSEGASVAALQNPRLQEQVITNVIAHARAEGETAILAQYEAMLVQLQSTGHAVIPKYYHGTSEEGLEGILRSGKIEYRFDSVFPGAYVSGIPEDSYGNFWVVLGDEVEHVTGSTSRQPGRLWYGSNSDIELTRTERLDEIAYIIAQDDLVDEARTILQNEEITHVEVIPLSQAERERELLTKARLNSVDRANVLVEQGVAVLPSTGPRFMDEYGEAAERLIASGDATTDRMALNRQVFAQMLDDLDDGEILIVHGEYSLVSVDAQGNRWLTHINPGTRQEVTRRLYSDMSEWPRGVGGDKAAAVENFLTDFDNYRTGLHVDPQRARETSFIELLANGEVTSSSRGISSAHETPVRIADSLIDGEVWEFHGAEYIYRQEAGWSKRALSDLSQGDAVSSEVLVELELHRRAAQNFDVNNIQTLHATKGLAVSEGEMNDVFRFIDNNPSQLDNVPEGFVNSYNEIMAGNSRFTKGINDIAQGLVPPNHASLVSLESTGVTVLQDHTGDLILRYGDNQVNLNNPNIERRIVKGQFGIVLESSDGVDTVIYLGRNNEYRVAYVNQVSAPRVVPSGESISHMSREIDSVLTESRLYADIQAEEGALLRLRAQHPAAFDEAISRKYHDISSAESIAHRERVIREQLTSLAETTGRDRNVLEQAVEALSGQIQSEYVAAMPHTHTTKFDNLESILNSGALRGRDVASSRDALKGAQGNVFTFRGDPGTLTYGDVTIILPKRSFGAETIYLPGDLKNGVQSSLQAGEETISFGTKIQMAMHADDADTFLSSSIAMDTISRRTAVGQSLDDIVESLSREDLLRYYLSKPLEGGSARISDLTAIGRVEAHTAEITLEGATIVVGANRLPEIEHLLRENDLLGNIRVIGVDSTNWGHFDSTLGRVTGGKEDLRMNVFAIESGFHDGNLAQQGDNIFLLEPTNLPDLTLTTVRPKSIHTQIFEEYSVPNQMKGIIGPRITQYQNDGKTSEEIFELIREEFGVELGVI